MTGGRDRRHDADDLLAKLRGGDETAFRVLVRRHQRSMVSVAQTFVRSRSTAEEVVQDTWLALIEGLDAFEGRSSLKNWLFAILVNKARRRGAREGRVVLVADFEREAGDAEPVVDPARFDAAGAWSALPSAWDDMTPERIVAGRQLLFHVQEAIDRLPPVQRSVLVMREVEHLDAAEVSSLLGVSDGNQRVLLHRARARVRDHLEKLLGT